MTSPTGNGLVFAGARVPVLGRNVISYLDDPRLRLKLPEDGRTRPGGYYVQSIGLHTTRGAPDSDDKRPQTLLPGAGPSTRAGYDVVEDWRTDHRCAGGHIVVDFDGVIYQLADLVTETTYHATSINHRSIGIEYKQGRAQNELYAEQLAAGCDVVDAITARLGIQRQIPDRYRGPLARLSSGGADYWGVFGHRDQTDRRGFGDPGDYVMAALAARGYERHNLLAGDDKRVWRERQRALGFRASSCDGLPGPLTRAALERQGYGHGLWALPPERTAA